MKLTQRLSNSPNIPPSSQTFLFDWLLKLAFTKKIKKGEFIIKEGDICDKLYYVEKGLFRIYRLENDKEITTWFSKEGDFVTTVNSFHFGIPSKEYFEAIEDATINFISKKSYFSLVELSTSFAKFSINELFHNLCEYQNQCEILRTLNAIERFNYIEEKFPYLLTRVKNKYLSTFINIEPTYLSKIKGKKFIDNE